MPYQNTGAYRHRTLTVQPRKDGENFGAAIVFSILSEFTDPESQDTYNAINATEFAKITDAAYLTRRAAFLRYVYADERVAGFISDDSFTNVSHGPKSSSVGLLCEIPVQAPEVDPGGTGGGAS